ncbi:type II toxin-antitoxin system HicB family antitoxin [Cyanobacteria bacterium FACHB-63]|nr:type II toxin-antitoxin system HicB family antitoxin [Cyanobacteria bacterium FACHB-63]
MNLEIELDQETDGRWIAEMSELPGVLAYGSTRDDAISKTKVLALRVIADRIEHGESTLDTIAFVASP